MQICPAASHFPNRIDLNAIRGANDPDQRAFWQYCQAANAGPLGNVFSSLSGLLLRHRCSQIQTVSTTALPIHRRACASSS